MKLATNIRHVSGKCRKCFKVRGQMSKVKVMTRPINLQRRRHTFRRCDVENHLFVVTVCVCVCSSAIDEWLRPSTEYSAVCILTQYHSCMGTGKLGQLPGGGGGFTTSLHVFHEKM